MAITIKRLIEILPQAFVGEKAEGLEATVQFNLSGKEKGHWYGEIENGKLKISEGTIKNATLTISADSEDLIDLITGKLNPASAFMFGKVKIDGNTKLALKFIELFDFDRVK